MSTAVATRDAAPAAEDVEHDTEVMACSMDPVYFVDGYGVIDAAKDAPDDDAPDRTGATVPFKLWPEQKDLVWDLMTEKLVVILKARQLGISWCVCAFVLWHCLFAPGRRALLFSKGQMEANELLRRVRVLYERLPEWFRDRVPRLVEQNTRSLVFSNASRVQSMPATTSAGVSYTATLVVLDEAAKGQMKLNGSKLYTAVKPTIDSNPVAKMIVLSTAEGLGGFFHSLWTKAVEGLNNFRTVFLAWDVHPDRDPGFRARMLAESDDPKTVPQEYPENPVEAFVATGRLRFDPAWLVPMSFGCRDPIPVAAWPASLKVRWGWPGIEQFSIPHLWELPGLRVYTPPEPGVRYLLAADVAEGKDPEGKSDSDYNAGVLIRWDTLEEVASLHGRWEPDLFALYLMALSEPYNRCEVAVERNNHGHTVLATFKHHKFPHDRVCLGHDGWPGWLTTQVTKDQGVDLLARLLRDSLMAVRTLAALYQFQGYTVLKNGRTGAVPPNHDDYVSAWNVGVSYVRHRNTLPVGGPAELGGQAPRLLNHIR